MAEHFKSANHRPECLNNTGLMHPRRARAGICLAAFAPVSITITSQVLEVQKQLAKRLEDEDDESDDDEADSVKMINPLDSQLESDGDEADSVKMINPLDSQLKTCEPELQPEPEPQPQPQLTTTE